MTEITDILPAPVASLGSFPVLVDKIVGFSLSTSSIDSFRRPLRAADCAVFSAPSSDVVVVLASVEVPSRGVHDHSVDGLLQIQRMVDDGDFTCAGTTEIKIGTAHAS